MKRAPLLTKAFALCALSNCLFALSFNLFLHLPGFLEELGAGPVVIGWMFSLPALVAIAVRPSVGSTMDRRGRRPLMLAGHAANIAACTLYLAIDSVGPALYGVRILHGVSEAVLFTVLFTYAADIVPTSRLTEGLAIFGASSMLPMSLSGLLGDWILARGDYPILFATALGFGIAAGVAALPLRDAKRLGDGEGGEPSGFLAALGARELRPIWWMAAVFFTALAAIFVFLKTFVIARGVGSVGGFFSAYTAVAIALRLGLGWLPDRIGPKRVLLPAVVALAAGFAALAAARSTAAVAWAGALCGLGHGYTFPILCGLVVRRTRIEDRGSAIAIYTGIADVGIVVGGPAFGVLLELWDYGVMYATVASGLLVGLLGFVLWDRGNEERLEGRAVEGTSGDRGTR